MKFIVAVQRFKDLGHRVVYSGAEYEIRSRAPVRNEGLVPEINNEWRIPLGFVAISDVEYSCLVAKMRTHPEGPLPLTAEDVVQYAQSASLSYVALRSPQQAMADVLFLREHASAA